MSRWLAARTLSIVPTMIGVAVLVFLLIRLIPGTVVDQILGAQFSRSEGQVDALRPTSDSINRSTPSSGSGSRTSSAAISAPPGGPASRSGS